MLLALRQDELRRNGRNHLCAHAELAPISNTATERRLSILKLLMNVTMRFLQSGVKLLESIYIDIHAGRAVGSDVLSRRASYPAGKMPGMPPSGPDRAYFLINLQGNSPWAKAIREQVRSKQMPPWPADPCCGHFSNDRSLSAKEIEVLSKWADTGAQEGSVKDAPPARKWPVGWNLPAHDLELGMDRPFELPATGAVAYSIFRYIQDFPGDRWIQARRGSPGKPSGRPPYRGLHARSRLNLDRWVQQKQIS